MPDTALDRLLARRQELLTARLPYEAIWGDIGDYILPTRRGFTSTVVGAKKTEKLFDSTALMAADRLASNMAGSLTSDAFQWFSLKFRDEDLNEIEDVAIWAEECAKRMFRAFNQSNFSAEGKTTYKDLVALATDALFIDERPRNGPRFEGLVCRALALSEYVIGEDYEQKVDTLFRNFQISAQAAVMKWGFAALGRTAQKLLKDGKPDTPLQFVHAVVPRAAEKIREGRVVRATNMPWASYWIEESDKQIVSEGGYHEFPFIVTRWDKAAGELYGTGPGHMALPDVKTLNKARELALKMWAKHLDPPTKSLDDGVVGPIRNTPGGNTVCRSSIEGIQPLYPPGMFAESSQANQINQEDLRKSVRAAFYADQLEIPIGPMMTAYEFAKRLELMERLLGPTLGRVKSEKLNPTINRVFGLMLRAGAFPDPPEVLRNRGADIDIEYEGPLAKSQRLSEVEAMERWNAIMLSISQLKPDVIDNADFDQEMNEIADVLGVPKKVVREAGALAKIRAERADREAQEQQASDLERAAQGLGKAAPALALLSGRQAAGGGG